MRRPVVIASLLLAWVAAARGELTVAPVDSLTLPPGTISGLTWVGGDTLAVLAAVEDPAVRDAGATVTYLILQDTRGDVLTRQDVTGTLTRGLAYDGQFFWGCGDDAEGGSLLYQVDGQTLQVLQSFPTPGHRPMDLCWDGRWIWVSDRDSARLDRYDPETGQVTRTVPAPAFSPCGLTWDGSAFWLTDSATGRLYRLRGSRLGSIAVADAGGFLWPGRDVLLMHDGASLYYLLQGSQIAIRLTVF